MQLAVQQVAGHHVLQRLHDHLGTAGVGLFPLAQHVAHLLALQVLLAAAQVAGNDGELHVLGPARGVFFLHIGQRADHHEFAVVAYQLGRHALELGAEEHVQEESRHDVVAVVAQRDLVAAQAARHRVQNAATQARAQAAHGLAFGNLALDDAVGVLRLDVEGHAHAFQIGRQDLGRKARLLLVQVHRHDLEVDWRAFLQLEQHVQQREAVLAAAHAHHHLVAFLDHVEVDNGLPGQAAQALVELVHLALQARLGRVLGRAGGGVGRLLFGSLGGNDVGHGKWQWERAHNAAAALRLLRQTRDFKRSRRFAGCNGLVSDRYMQTR